MFRSGYTKEFRNLAGTEEVSVRWLALNSLGYTGYMASFVQYLFAFAF